MEILASLKNLKNLISTKKSPRLPRLPNIKSNIFVGFFSLILTIGFGVGTAFAANSVIEDISIEPTPFFTQIPQADPAPVLLISYKYNSGGWTTADIVEQIKDNKGNVVYYWGTNQDADTKQITNPGLLENVKLTWNGKANTGSLKGQYVPDGDYTFFVSSRVNTPPDTQASAVFHVEKTVAPLIKITSTSGPIFYNANGSQYSINYNLSKGSGTLTIIRLTIQGPSNGAQKTIIVIDNSKSSDGIYSLKWDGKDNNGDIAATGDYTYKIDAITNVNDYSVSSNIATGAFKVSNTVPPNPVLKNLSAKPNIYKVGNGLISFTYNLSGSLGFTNISAVIYNSNDLNTPVKSFNLASQANGDNQIAWNGIDTDSKDTQVPDGNYILKLTGTDGEFVLIPQQVSFSLSAAKTETQVQTQETTEKIVLPANIQCSGFTDVSSSDPDCDALKYIKSIGAMTGNPDGSFAPDDLLQRDQSVKIVLETFDLYNKQLDYCNNRETFPDTSKKTWSYNYICRGTSLGVVTGYLSGKDAGLFVPGRALNRAEFLALLLRNLQEDLPSNANSSYTDVAPGQWFSGYAKYSKDHNLFTGSQLNPTQFTTRREVAEIIYKLHIQGKI